VRLCGHGKSGHDKREQGDGKVQTQGSPTRIWIVETSGAYTRAGDRARNTRKFIKTGFRLFSCNLVASRNIHVILVDFSCYRQAMAKNSVAVSLRPIATGGTVSHASTPN
jgi:hypothetical protein